MFGTPFMPWQRMIADVGGELVRDEETGFWVPAYPEVVIVIMRQNGKTTLKFAWCGDRLMLWEAFDGRPQAAVYTAQSGTDAREKFRADWLPAWEESKLWPAVKGKPRLSADSMGLNFKNGARLRVLNSGEKAGHGITIDFAMMDEIFADTDNAREQVLIPAMATRHDSQILGASTAGTEKSVLLNRKMSVGRKAVEQGLTQGTAYFEFSADPEASDYDPEDPKLWWECMPALGYTITERTVAQALNQMKEEEGGLAEFERAWLNVRNMRGGKRVIPVILWDIIVKPDARPSGDVALAVEADPDKTRAAIASADSQGNAKIVAFQAGTSWVVDELVKQSAGRPVVVDERGPLGHLIVDMQRADINVVTYNTEKMVKATGHFWEALADSSLKIKYHEALDIAAQNASKKSVGDTWLWKRTADSPPLIAVTLALHAALNVNTVEPFSMYT